MISPGIHWPDTGGWGCTRLPWSYRLINSSVPGAHSSCNGLTVAITGHAFRKNTAGAFGPDLAKKLSQLVKMEKNVMRSMELVARERMEVAVRGCPRI